MADISSRPFRTMGRLIALRQPLADALEVLQMNASLADAARLITTSPVEAFVVLDGEAVVGILSRDDFARMAAKSEQWRAAKVRDAMHATSAHAQLDTTVVQALAIMDDNGLDHLPVMANGRVVGVFARAALLEELVHHYREVIRDMQLREQIMHLQGVYSC